MELKKSVLIVGLDPVLIDFSSPDFAPQSLSADRVMSAAFANSEQLRGLGYEADLCLTDFGETAASSVGPRMFETIPGPPLNRSLGSKKQVLIRALA